MIIQVDNLHKTYGDVKAVNGISFAVQEGSLFSFLGTNGAGKSTTINVLTTLISKTSGTVAVGGFDVSRDAEKVRDLIGIGVSRHDFDVMAGAARVDKSWYFDFPDFEDAVWLKPILVCRVEYMERTPGGGLRQPVFRGLREDKTSEECVYKQKMAGE